MPGTEVRGPSAHTRIGPQRGRLRNAAIVFEQISADVDARPDAWLVAIGVALDEPGRRLERARRLHRGSRRPVRGAPRRVAGRGGARGRPAPTRPRGARSPTSPGPASCWPHPDAGPDDTRILLSLTGIAKQVDQHRRRGSDLLYQVYSVDVSAGD